MHDIERDVAFRGRDAEQSAVLEAERVAVHVALEIVVQHQDRAAENGDAGACILERTEARRAVAVHLEARYQHVLARRGRRALRVVPIHAVDDIDAQHLVAERPELAFHGAAAPDIADLDSVGAALGALAGLQRRLV